MIIMGLCLLGVVAASISSCTPLPPRRSPPRNINDLRIDDFKAIMAMGDSMSAGSFCVSRLSFILHAVLIPCSS